MNIRTAPSTGKLGPAMRAILPALALAFIGGCSNPPPAATPAAQQAARPANTTAAARPNVLVIIADDLGSNDLSVAGGRIPTPNLDRLAKSGIRYTEGYATAAVCAPSRSGLLAGRQQNRFGFEFNPVGRDETLGMSLKETTIAQTMKAAGYRTGMVGKWHIGQGPGFHPLDRGFDSFYGVLGGGTPYWKTKGEGDLQVATAEDRIITRERLPLVDGRTPVDPEGYVTDLFTDRAIDFIGAGKRGQPFFLYLSYTAPHTPLQATAKYLKPTKPGQTDYHRVYDAMVDALDQGVGRVMDHLRKTGQLSDTLVFVVSDNGCPSYVGGACSNAPLNGWKGYPHEGGLRVPFLMSWPARIKPAVRGDIVSTLDIAATAAAVARTTHPKAEGIDLVGKIDDGVRLEDRSLFWRNGPNLTVRHGRWKLIVVNKAAAPAGAGDELGRSLRADGLPAEVSPLGQWVLLYDLEKDPGEKNDVAARHPEVVQDLRRRWAAWNEGNVAPQWTSRRSLTAEIDGARFELFN